MAWPSRSLENACRFHFHGAWLHRRAPAVLHHRPAGRVQYLRQLAGLGEVRRLGQLPDGVIQLAQHGGELAVIIGRLAVLG